MQSWLLGGHEGAEGGGGGPIPQRLECRHLGTRPGYPRSPVTYQAWHLFCHYADGRGGERWRETVGEQGSIQAALRTVRGHPLPTIRKTHACVSVGLPYCGSQQKSAKVAGSERPAKAGAQSPRTATCLSAGLGACPLQRAPGANQMTLWP